MPIITQKFWHLFLKLFCAEAALKVRYVVGIKFCCNHCILEYILALGSLISCTYISRGLACVICWNMVHVKLMRYVVLRGGYFAWNMRINHTLKVIHVNQNVTKNALRNIMGQTTKTSLKEAMQAIQI